MRLFIFISIIGFLFPYILKFLLLTNNELIKLFAIYSLNKFNLVYFGIVILFFFIGLKYKPFRLSQIIFVILFISYLFLDFFMLSKIKAKKFIKKDLKLVKITKLKNFKHFKLIYKDGLWAVIKIEEKNTTLPFNYKKRDFE